MWRSLYEQFADNAESLFDARQAMLASLRETATDLAVLERRLQANLDGLVAGLPASWEVLGVRLSGGDPDSVFVTAWVAREADEEQWQQVLEVAAGAAGSFATALGLWPTDRDPARLQALLGDGPPPLRPAALAAATARGLGPPAELVSWIRGDDQALAAAAALAAGRQRLASATTAVRELAQSASGTAGDAAREAWSLLEPEAARLELLARARADRATPQDCRLLAGLADAESVDALAALARATDAHLSRAAVLALADAGDPGAVPALLAALSTHPGPVSCALARMFGDCLSLEPREPPAPDDDAEWSPDDELPRFSPTELDAWWSASGPTLSRGQRLRRGAPWRPAPPDAGSPLWHRHQEALEHALANPGIPLVETCGWQS